MVATQKFDVDVKDVEYQRQGGKPLLARIYQPKGTGPFPSIIDVHGGAWHNGDRTNNKSIDRMLAERGIIVAALDFRQPPEAAYPASIADVNLGIRWLKAHAKELKGTGKVGAFGNSSGGHQVVIAALRPKDPRYAALLLEGASNVDASLDYVVAGWPVIDPLFRYRFAQQKGRNELVDAHLEYWETEEAMAEGSPQTSIEQDTNPAMPPILMVLKNNDQNHPQEMQERFIASYKKRGGPIEVHWFDSLAEHGMVPTPEEPETMRAMDIMTAFIQRHGS
jgi:acetyl esterase/lipase